MARSEEPASHILMIRLSAMGDVAMTVPVLKAFLSKYPDTKVTVLTRAFFAPLFVQIPNVTIYPADVKGRHQGLIGLWRLQKELKRLDIDAIADLHHVLRSTILKVFFWFSGIRFARIDKGRADKKALTTGKNKIFKPLKSTFQRYSDVFDALGFPVDLSAAEPLERHPISKKIKGLSGTSNGIKIGIAPFAAFQGKMYPLHLMEKVIGELDRNGAYSLFFFGGGSKEIERLDRWEAEFKNGFNCAGKFALGEELTLISNLDLMLSMDSGNGHLAAMYGVPVLTLWGITHPYAGFSPFGQGPNNSLLADRAQYPHIPTSVYGNKMPKGYERAMETIPPEKVVRKIAEILTRK